MRSFAMRSSSGKMTNRMVRIAQGTISWEMRRMTYSFAGMSSAAVPDSAATPITTIPFETGNWAVWIGNEGNGLTNEAIEHCHDRVTIPMRGRAESFNASTAAAIVLWEMERNGAGGTSHG